VYLCYRVGHLHGTFGQRETAKLLFVAPSAMAAHGEPRVLDLRPNTASRAMCVLVRAYHRSTPQAIFALVSSLVRSAHHASLTVNFTFVDTDARVTYYTLSTLVSKLSAMFGGNTTSFVLAQQAGQRVYRAQRFPDFGDDDFGFIATDDAMEDLLRGNCEHVLITNADNLYAKSFFSLVLAELDNGKDLALVQFVSRYKFSWKLVKHMDCALKCGTRRPGSNQVFFPQPTAYCLDLGAVVFSAASVRKTGLRFITADVGLDKALWKTTKHEFVVFAPACSTFNGGRPLTNARWKNSARDGIFFRDLVQASSGHLMHSIINNTLFVHQ